MIKRPMPPEFKFNGEFTPLFLPALDIGPWLKETIVNPKPGNKMYNQDHYHLYDFLDGHIGFMWAASGFESKGQFVLGMAEQITFRTHKWGKWRGEQQMMEWFGREYPGFLITLDGEYCAQCSDAEFCALLEHEMYHIGHGKDQFGMPAFHKDTGLPKLEIRGHDVEEFIGVVRRYGVGRKEGALSQLVAAANQKPEIPGIDIARACGNCLLRAA